MNKTKGELSQYGSSRSRTIWTGVEDANPLEKAVDLWNHDNFNRRHPIGPDPGEVNWINSIDLGCCKYCGSSSIIRYGKTDTGIRRYRCKDCGKVFSPITNTIFDSRHIPLSQWHDFLLDVFSYSSIHLASKGNRNSINTTTYWLKKVFLVLRGYQDNIILKDIAYIDESYYSLQAKDIQRKEDGTKYRGASRNQICIGVGCDKNGSVICLEEGKAHTSLKRTWNTFGTHIATGTHLIHDSEECHDILVDRLSLTSEAYDSQELKKLDDKDNPLDPVNRICFLLKKFLREHSGFDREYMQDFLNLFAFIANPPETKPEKVYEFMKMAISSNIVLRYRDQNIK